MKMSIKCIVTFGRFKWNLSANFLACHVFCSIHRFGCIFKSVTTPEIVKKNCKIKLKKCWTTVQSLKLTNQTLNSNQTQMNLSYLSLLVNCFIDSMLALKLVLENWLVHYYLTIKKIYCIIWIENVNPFIDKTSLDLIIYKNEFG